MKHVLAVLVSVFVFVPCVFAGSIPMQPGKWRVTVRMQIAGAPAIPPRTVNVCYSKGDLNEKFGYSKDAAARKLCRREYFRLSGSTVSWKDACTNGMETTGEMTLSSGGTSYVMKTISKVKGRSTVMNSAGKRIGNCQ